MKAIVMLSGGLDSTLALKLMYDLGIEVLALHFSSPFCRCDGSKGCGSSAQSVADFVGVEMKNVYVGEEYLEIVKHPKHGYGKNINPCIDCRIHKFKYAKDMMKEVGASFIVTGEVLGQRPMSQHRRAMDLIEKEAELEGLIVRPLSAKLMPPTIPEKEGWIDRERLLDFHGRNRTPQIQLAEEWGIADYPCPAGGCLLTDPGFSRRMKDLMEFGEVDMNNAQLLKAGRHFRITPEYKLIVGRNEQENSVLEALRKEDDIFFDPEPLSGPSAVGRGKYNEDIIALSAGIVARYMHFDTEEVEIGVFRGKSGERENIRASAVSEEELEGFRI